MARVNLSVFDRAVDRTTKAYVYYSKLRDIRERRIKVLVSKYQKIRRIKEVVRRFGLTIVDGSVELVPGVEYNASALAVARSLNAMNTRSGYMHHCFDKANIRSTMLANLVLNLIERRAQ